MKCPKCGYYGFEHVDNCKKCGQDLVEHKLKFNLKGFFSPGQAITTRESAADNAAPATENSEDDNADFGFDFLEEEEGLDAGNMSLGKDTANVSIDQPFGVDAESIPADDLATDLASDAKTKEGSDFSF